jgi:hypothetical protein
LERFEALDLQRDMVQTDLVVLRGVGLRRHFEHGEVMMLFAQAEEYASWAFETGDDFKAQHLGVELLDRG